MTFWSRSRVAWTVAIIVASWPSALAAALVRGLILNRHAASAGAAFAIATVLSAALAGGVSWRVWKRTRDFPGMWMLWAMITAFPICSIWTALGEASRTDVGLMHVLKSAVLMLPYASPLMIVGGLALGFEIAVLQTAVARAYQTRGGTAAWRVLVIVVLCNYGIALWVAIRWNMWK